MEQLVTSETEQTGLVSVLISTYNIEGHIAETLESVFAQTYQPIEVVVVDDGSTDGTWDVLQSYGSRIRAIRQQNGGLGASRSTGVRAARGEFVAIVDHDDLCEPERIAVQVACMRQHPDLVLCSSDFSSFNQDGLLEASSCAGYYSQCHSSRGGVAARYPEHTTLDISEFLHPKPNLPTPVPVYLGNVYQEIALGNFVHPPTIMFRRNAVLAVGDFDPSLRIICDWDWLVRMARLGRFGFIHRSLLRYRRSDRQLSSDKHLARIKAESLTVAMRICSRDPELVRRSPTAFRSYLGQLYLGAADANAESHRLLAIRLWATSVFRYSILQDRTFRTLLKILMPSFLLDAIREHRG